MAEPIKPLPHDTDDAALAESIERARTDMKAGRVFRYETIRRWLLSWGTPDELPPPKNP